MRPREPVITHVVGQSRGMLEGLLEMATQAKRWDIVQALGAQLEDIERAEAFEDPKVTSLDAARKRRGK